MEIETNILSALKAGKEEGLNRLYSSFFHPLCVFGCRFVGEEEVVADVVQEIFIKVWERRKNFDSIYSIRSFMYVSVRNACLNYKRDHLRIQRITLSEVVDEELFDTEESCWVIEEEVHRLIKNEIDRLPEAMKKVIDLTLLDLSIPDIAGVLNLSENTVRNQRVRAREILRSKLGDKLFLLFF